MPRLAPPTCPRTGLPCVMGCLAVRQRPLPDIFAGLIAVAALALLFGLV